MRVRCVPVQAIEPDPEQPRKEFDEQGLEQLARSIQAEGLLQPIVVRPVAEGRFRIVAGERRWRAVVRLGWETVPAIVRDEDEARLKRLQLLENLVRRDISPVETARAYRRLMDQGMTAKEIGQAIGVDPSVITYWVKILDCREDILHLIHRGQLRPMLGYYLAKLPGHLQGKVVKRVLEERLTVDEGIALCEQVYAQEVAQGKLIDRKSMKNRARVAKQVRSVAERVIRLASTVQTYEAKRPGSVRRDITGEDRHLLRQAAKALKEICDVLGV